MSSPSPIVSIVIPVYNGANYLREAIDSGLAQTYPATEVIVVNDGSTDGGRTREVAASFGDRIRYFEKENGGVATALNRGIREMRGEYFSWLSHDDIYDSEKVARQVSCVEALGDETAIPFCNYHVIDHASRITSTGSVDESLLGNSILLVVGTHVNGCSLLIPKAAFESAGLFNESLKNSQDNEMWLRMVISGYRLRPMSDVLIRSRAHADQGSRTSSLRHAQEARAFYLWALEFIGGNNRVANAAGLYRILLVKRLPSVVTVLFRRLCVDRSFVFALGSFTVGASGMTRAWMVKRIGALPGAVWLKGVVERHRFRNSSHYWQQRYARGESSGVGSYGRFAEYKAAVLNAFVAAHGVVRVAEFGCGDGNQLKSFTFAQYMGVDVSPAAIARCRAMYKDDQTKSFLLHTGAESLEAVRRFAPELTISLDVIYHLVENAVFEAHIASLFELSSRYVIVYSTNFDRQYDSPHQVDRRFTDYIEKRIRGWKLIDVMVNPHKGVETQSDFYIYEKIADALQPGGAAAS